MEKTQMDVRNAKVVGTEPLENKDARWTRLVLTHYIDPSQKKRTWESAIRPTRSSPDAVDAVGIVAILSRPGKPPTMLLQKQFRPAIGKVCIEVPAGLIDAGETAETAALRELREETGYTGKIIAEKGFGVSPVWYNDPGFTNTNVQMVHVTINLDAEANKDVQPQMDEGEFIENFEVEMEELWRVLEDLEGEGYVIDARVGGLAEGIEVARRFGFGS